MCSYLSACVCGQAVAVTTDNINCIYALSSSLYRVRTHLCVLVTNGITSQKHSEQPQQLQWCENKVRSSVKALGYWKTCAMPYLFDHHRCVIIIIIIAIPVSSSTVSGTASRSDLFSFIALDFMVIKRLSLRLFTGFFFCWDIFLKLGLSEDNMNWQQDFSIHSILELWLSFITFNLMEMTW